MREPRALEIGANFASCTSLGVRSCSHLVVDALDHAFRGRARAEGVLSGGVCITARGQDANVLRRVRVLALYLVKWTIVSRI